MSAPTEAKIEVIWPQYEIKDLGLRLVSGGEAHFVPQKRAEASKDLREAQRLGAVRVLWVQRCRVSKPPKPPAPPSVRRIKPAARKQPVSPSIDEDAIAAKVAEKLSANLNQRDERLRKELREMVSKGVSLDPEKLASLLAAGLVDKLPTQQTAATQASSSERGADTPVSEEIHYIPSKIISKTTKANIKTSKAQSDAGQADNAAAKLAALRRKKKQSEESDD